MEILHKIKMDLVRQGISPRIPVVQGDTYSRKLVISLFADKKPWRVPQDAAIVIRYQKPDRSSGAYDTLADGTSAVSVSGNSISILIAPEALSQAGLVSLMVTILQGQQRLSTFAIDLAVEADCVTGLTDQQGSAWIAAFLPSPADAQSGQYLTVKQVDEKGYVVAVESTALPEPDPEIMEAAVAQYLETHDISGADGKDGADGEDGLIPFIGDNGNWWIGDTDTGVPATGSSANEENTLLEEQTVTGFASATALSPVALEMELGLELGQTYTVVWDGEEHVCVCSTGAGAQGTSISSPYLGNPGIFLKETGAADYPDTGEAFLIIDGNNKTVLYTSEEGDSHSLAIYIGGDSTPKLPMVAAADNGKFLRVVDGAWAAAAVETAEEASF